MTQRLTGLGMLGVLVLLIALLPGGCRRKRGGATGSVSPIVLSEAPRFDGVRSVATAGGALFRLDWLPAEDDVTSEADTVYQVFTALTSGGQDFDAPALTTSSGDLTAFVSAFESTDVRVGNVVHVVVRAIDGDGQADDNTTELSVLLVDEADVRFIAPGATGTGLIGSPTSSIQAAIDSIESGAAPGVVIMGTGSVSLSQSVQIGAGPSAVAVALYGGFDLSSLEATSAPIDVLEVRDPSIGADESQVTASGSLSGLLVATGGERVAIDGLTFSGAPSSTIYVAGDGADLRISGSRFEGDASEADSPTLIGISLTNTTSTVTVLRLTGSDLANNLAVGVRVEGLTKTIVIQGCRFDSIDSALLTQDALGVLSSIVVPSASLSPTGDPTLEVVISDNLLRPIFNTGMSFLFSAESTSLRGDLAILVARNIFHQIGDDAVQLRDVGLFGDGGDANLGTATIEIVDNDAQVISGDVFDLAMITQDAINAGATNIDGHVIASVGQNRFAAVDGRCVDVNAAVRASSTTSVAIADAIATGLGDDFFELAGMDVTGSDGGSVTISIDGAALTGIDGGAVDIDGRLLPQNGTFSCVLRDIIASAQDTFSVRIFEVVDANQGIGTPDLVSVLEVSGCASFVNDDEDVMSLTLSPADGQSTLLVTDNVLSGDEEGGLVVTAAPGEGDLDVLVARNEVFNIQDNGLDLSFGATATGVVVVEVSDNVLSNIDDTGIDVDLTTGGTPNTGEITILVANNRVEGSSGSSLRLDDATGATVSVFALIAQNTTVAGGETGITVDPSPGGRYLIANNAVSFIRNDGEGVSFLPFGGGPNAALIRNNVVAATADDGIDLDADDFPVQIENNTLFENGDGSREDGGIDSDTDDGFSQAFVVNTIVSRPSGFAIGGSSLATAMRASYTLTEDGLSAAGFENFEADPGYAFAGTQFDFDTFYALGPDSLARDRGNPDSRFFDLDGTRNDLGAFGGPGGYGVGVREDLASVPFVLIGTDPFVGLETGAALTTSTTAVRLVFSREIDSSTVTEASVRIVTSQGTHGATLSTSGRVITITPDTPLPAGEVVTIEALSDGIEAADGDPLAVTAFFDFGVIPTVAISELEPNDSTASSTDLGADVVVEVATAALSSLSDVDVYRVTGVTAGERLQVSVIHKRDGAVADDVGLELLDASGAVLHLSRDRFGDSTAGPGSTDPYIDFVFNTADVAASSGIFFVRVNADASVSAPGSYRLQLTRR